MQPNDKTIINFIEHTVNYCKYLIDSDSQHGVPQNSSIETMLKSIVTSGLNISDNPTQEPVKKELLTLHPRYIGVQLYISVPISHISPL